MSQRRFSPARRSARHDAHEAIVQRYLRGVIGAPVPYARDASNAEGEFISVAKQWAERIGVDRGTLLALGVDRRVLDQAGVITKPVNERLHRYWEPVPFSIADLARRSGMPLAAVRRAVAIDEEEGRLRRVGREGRTILYGGN